jgi:hypothetical protein
MLKIDDLKNVSVSWGTLQPSHLINNFVTCLTYLDNTHNLIQTGNDWLKRFERWENLWNTGRHLGWLDEIYDDLVTEGDDLLEALFDTLDEFAPSGYYFGTHPGDGSDFGFWQIDYSEYESEEIEE